ncbi:MAG: hypothetical protein JWL62_1010 [Hyphomicrobiales bacterium]|nr:hypothetical protein [Hyphomicrobiales bacterium]
MATAFISYSHADEAWRLRYFLPLAGFLVALLTVSANGQAGHTEYDMCRAADNALDRIRLCTTALQTTSDRQLRERILLRRGNSFQEREQYHEAI